MNQTYATTRRLVAKETCVKETWTRGGYVKVELVERKTSAVEEVQQYNRLKEEKVTL